MLNKRSCIYNRFYLNKLLSDNYVTDLLRLTSILIRLLLGGRGVFLD
jgi:hypothetical protein